MTSLPQTLITDDERHLLVHQFIRLFGRRPTEAELQRYQRAHGRLRTGLPARARRRAALLVSRL